MREEVNESTSQQVNEFFLSDESDRSDKSDGATCRKFEILKIRGIEESKGCGGGGERGCLWSPIGA